jgi:hypothetical protein
MEKGDRITEGTLWRGIGPREPVPSAPGAPVPGRPYHLRDHQVEFTPEAFYDRTETHPDGQQKTLEPSVLLDAIARNPADALAKLKATGRSVEALAGLSVLDILNSKHRTSEGGPTKNTGAGAPMMAVIFDPVLDNGVDLGAHCIIRPEPRWHPNQGPLRAMRKSLAELASEFHRRSGWVLAPGG